MPGDDLLRTCSIKAATPSAGIGHSWNRMSALLPALRVLPSNAMPSRDKDPEAGSMDIAMTTGTTPCTTSPSASQTVTPLPGTRRTRASRSSRASAERSVLRATPSSAASFRSGGRNVAGGYAPDMMRP